MKLTEAKKKKMMEYRKLNRDKINKQKREHYKINNKEILKKQKDYQDKNKERINKRKKLKYQKERDKISKIRKVYYLNNKDKVKEYKATNKDKINKGKRKNRIQKMQNDPEFLLKERVRSNFKRCFRRFVKSGKMYSSKKYGFDAKSIIEYLKPLPKDIENYEVHHIIPLHTFKFTNKDGTTNLKEVAKAFAPENHKLITIEEHKRIHQSI